MYNKFQLLRILKCVLAVLHSRTAAVLRNKTAAVLRNKTTMNKDIIIIIIFLIKKIENRYSISRIVLTLPYKFSNQFNYIKWNMY